MLKYNKKYKLFNKRFKNELFAYVLIYITSKINYERMPLFTKTGNSLR